MMVLSSFVRLRARVPAGASIATLALLCGTSVPAFASTALHPGDKVAVTVYGHPELSTSGSTLDAAGNISLPVAGMVPAEDASPTQLAARIEARLATYVVKPVVEVQLTEQSQTVFVSGGPGGVLPYHPGETLTSILDQLELPLDTRPSSVQNPYDVTSSSGGDALPQQAVVTGPYDLYDSPVDYHDVSVLRDGKVLGPFDVLALRAVGDPGMTLQPADTVQLRNKPIAVRVEGNVLHPGMAYVEPGQSLARAIDQVGGTTAVASESLELRRAGETQISSLGSPAFAGPAQNGDVVVVPRAPRVDVLGTVVKPGEQYLRGDDTLVSAIYYAGGPDKYANLKSVQVIHRGVKTQYDVKNLQKGRDGTDPRLADGDVVFVPQGSTVNPLDVVTGVLGFGYLITR